MRYELYLARFDWENDCDEVQDKPHFMASSLPLARKVVELYHEGKFAESLGALYVKYPNLRIFDIETGEFVE